MPVGMTSAIVNYFTSHNVRVMLSAGGATYTSFWDQALSTNATQLGINAAKLAKAMGVGIEIDYENDASPNLAGLQEFISAYRSMLSYDPTGANPAARLTIDLAAGDRFLVALCRKATSDWLSGANPVLDYANATVPNGQPSASQAEANWQEHVVGRTNVNPPILPLPPAKVTVGVRLVIGSTAQPECNDFSMSLQNSTGIFVRPSPAQFQACSGTCSGGRRPRPRIHAREEQAWVLRTTASAYPCRRSGSSDECWTIEFLARPLLIQAGDWNN